MPATGSYSREQSSPLYTVDTTGEAVEVVCGAAGRAAEVDYSAAGRAAEVDYGAAGEAARY